MAICKRCGKDIGLLGNLISFNKKTERCGKCESEIKQFLVDFRQDFIKACSDGLISEHEWKQLRASLERANINGEEAAAYVRGDALHLMERTLADAAADGIITDEEAERIVRLPKDLGVPANLSRPIFERLEYLKAVTEIRQGKIPEAKPTTTLEAGEVCYLETPATYQKVNKRSVSLIEGRLVATSKKMHFLSPTGGWTIQWGNVMRVEHGTRGIYLELSTKKGNGDYFVKDPLRIQAILDTAVRMQKRQLLVKPTEGGSRRIPQDVKTAVWQRDQGRCVECSSQSYLEYDHIIPFSRGGASTVDNVQILCRGCNSKKSDRI